MWFLFNFSSYFSLKCLCSWTCRKCAPWTEPCQKKKKINITILIMFDKKAIIFLYSPKIIPHYRTLWSVRGDSAFLRQSSEETHKHQMTRSSQRVPKGYGQQKPEWVVPKAPDSTAVFWNECSLAPLALCLEPGKQYQFYHCILQRKSVWCCLVWNGTWRKRNKRNDKSRSGQNLSKSRPK